MSRVGRPNKYETTVKPRLQEIEGWAKTGATNKEIANALGISMSAFCDYMNKYSELKDSVNAQRSAGVPEVKMALYRKAIGFEYEEKKTYLKKDEEGKQYQYTEITKKQSLPDINAIGMYLRNYDDEWRDSDNISNRFKEMEIELRKQMAETKNW